MNDNLKLWLAFFRSLSLADHVGDVSNDVLWMLKQFGMEDELPNDYEYLSQWLEEEKGVPHMCDLKAIAKAVPNA